MVRPYKEARRDWAVWIERSSVVHSRRRILYSQIGHNVGDVLVFAIIFSS